MKKILRILWVGLALSSCLFVGCKNTPKETEDSSPRQSESSNGNAIEFPEVEL